MPKPVLMSERDDFIGAIGARATETLTKFGSPSQTGAAMGRERGLTLIEFLVTMGIIAVILSVLVPAAVSVRGEARNTECRAHLHQIGQGLRMYLNDSRDRYPHAPALPSVNPHHHPSLPDTLEKYLPSGRAVFLCPADESLYSVEGTSYFYYPELGGRKLQETLFFRVLRVSARVPILWDATTFHGGSMPANWLYADGHVGPFELDDVRRNAASPPVVPGR